MDDLPTEILHYISRKLPVGARLLFRLTSTTINEAVLAPPTAMDLCGLLQSSAGTSEIAIRYLKITSYHVLLIAQQIGLINIELINVTGCPYTHHVIVHWIRRKGFEDKVNEFRVGPNCFRITLHLGGEIILRDDYVMEKLSGKYVVIKETCDWLECLATNMTTWMSTTMLPVDSYYSSKVEIFKKINMFPHVDASDELIRAYGYSDAAAYREAYTEYPALY